tara:strand:+ start:591 stop:1139 length:549 start_codon:yes stop_codon:yes gene_type:complete
MPGGLQPRCKTCVKARDKKKRADPEYRRREREQQGTEEAKKKRRTRENARGKSDWEKLKTKLANRLLRFVFDPEGDTPLNQATMGCTRAEMRAHLESQFTDSMSWDNYADVWELDHIVPYKAFPTVEELEKHHKTICWYLNVRPLPPPQNRSDRGNYNEEDKQGLIRRYQLQEIEREVLALL